jgi:hypothetical protein
MSPTPLVTVIVPNYNHARFLDRRLGGVLGQSFDDFELLFLDDASTDGSRAVFEAYRGDGRVRAIFNRRNSGGPFPQWNRGVRAARGRYVWIAESDDDAEPGLLEALIGPMLADDRVVLSYCESLLVDEQGHALMLGVDFLEECFHLAERGIDSGMLRSDFRSDGRALCLSHQRLFNLVPNASAVVFRRDAYLAAGAAPESLRLCGDWLTWGRMMLRGDVSYTARPLNRFRSHPATVRSESGRAGLNAFESAIASAWLARESGGPAADYQGAREYATSLLRSSILGAPPGPLSRGAKLRLIRCAAALDPSIVARAVGGAIGQRIRRSAPGRGLARRARRALVGPPSRADRGPDQPRPIVAAGPPQQDPLARNG